MCKITMCLELKVKLSAEDVRRSKEIAKLANQIEGLEIDIEDAQFRSRSSVVNILESGNPCGCTFLAEGFNRNALTWDMHPSSLPKIAQSLRRLRENTKAGFVFEALWQGDKPTEEKTVSIDE